MDNKWNFKKKKLKKVLIIGVAYKKDLDDTRESPSIDFIKILTKKKIEVDFHDPLVKVLSSRKLKKTYKSIPIDIRSLNDYDCVIILTDHTNINYKLIKKHSKLIVDTRNIYNEKTDKILKL